MRRLLVGLLMVLAVMVLLLLAAGPSIVERTQNRVTGPPASEAAPPARQLHARLFVADLHADSLLWGRDLLREASRGHVDLPRLVKGGVALQVFSIVSQVPGGLNYERNELTWDLITPLIVLERWPLATWRSPKERALYQARQLHETAARSGGRLTVIQSAADAERFAERRRGDQTLTAGLLAIEGLQVLEGRLANLDALRDAGFRMMGLTHFFDNPVGGSAHGLLKGGLTDFGREFIRRAEARQIIVDLAHASPQLIDDVLAVATRPLVVSHTGVKGTCDHIRNLSDDHVRRIAATGGVIGIGYWDAAVCDVSADGIVRAIAHVARIAGIDHVGLGSDFDGAITAPFDTTGLPLITDRLLAAGMPEGDIAKVMGGNVLRLLRAALPPA